MRGKGIEERERTSTDRSGVRVQRSDMTMNRRSYSCANLNSSSVSSLLHPSTVNTLSPNLSLIHESCEVRL